MSRRRGVRRVARREGDQEPTVLSWTWQEYAACREGPVDLFFGVDGEKPLHRDQREKAAVEICRRCPVTQECRRYALLHQEAYGVWGGTTEAGRLALRRAAQASPAA